MAYKYANQNLSESEVLTERKEMFDVFLQKEIQIVRAFWTMHKKEVKNTKLLLVATDMCTIF